MIQNQHTIGKPVTVSGIGLHTGVRSSVTFHPAQQNSGIRFVRTDLPERVEIPANVDYVVDISRGTTLGLKGTRIHTVEHVLGAVSGLEIDNILIELTGPEPPVMDGSAKPFVDALLSASVVKQDAIRNVLVIDKTVTYDEPGKGIDIHVTPSDRFRITFMLDYPSYPTLGTQYYALYSLKEDFINEISSARTFSLLSEVESLKNMGLIKGGTLDNAIIFVDKKVESENLAHLKKIFNITDKISVEKYGTLNNRQLRYANEPVRHKILDLIGDLTLLGMPIQGHVVAARSGHKANVEVVKTIRRLFEKQITQQLLSVENNEKKTIQLDISAINRILPHRYPFLLVDRITMLQPGECVEGIKNITINEPYFMGHFPERPVMPGVLILEAMGQTGGILLLNSISQPDSKLIFFTGMESVKFRKTVSPGDQLILKLKLVKARLGTYKMEGTATVDGQLVAEAQLTAALVEK
ncbi:MAG TPA: bifunctional UDP-3-O-[3-hydroxymyristoyl] N-acetylglucosamine deacetylase/3-hydroxyacyl-ACP dehydratase [Candidatus Marinimicrobia bacterium]|nr:bifunctional UDP-3-O-[3-hydroxymyristoyl] N-acetylglucosamine deacetylase/3-hydroxyacyl-ACP dehydratase [Candidatus Neomarinimicrobiota bacterium]